MEIFNFFLLGALWKASGRGTYKGESQPNGIPPHPPPPIAHVWVALIPLPQRRRTLDAGREDAGREDAGRVRWLVKHRVSSRHAARRRHRGSRRRRARRRRARPLVG